MDTAPIVDFHSDIPDNASSSNLLEYGHQFLAIVIEPHDVELDVVHILLVA
jgi:hypothetical protein